VSDYDTQNPIVLALNGAVDELQSVAAAIRESLGMQRLPGSGTFAFRRTTNGLPVMPGTEPSDFVVPDGFFAPGGEGNGVTSFMAFNPNMCPVILRGTSAGQTTIQQAEMFKGWPLSPGLNGPFSTQYPTHMSGLFYPCLGMAVPPKADWKPIWVFYGGGN
jgi:hypothetical protein